jgi:uncharacterized membrane protein
MSEKRSKYDTDPLDPDFVRQTEEFGRAGRETARTANEQARLNPDADAPTRRIDDPLSQSYPSIFVPPVQTSPPPPPYQQPPTYQQPTYQQSPYQQPTYRQPPYQQSPAANLSHAATAMGAPQKPAPPTSRTIAGLGIPENIALVVPYVPFYIGIVGAVLELLLVPRTETRVRFHAAQGLALQLAMLAISLMLGFIGSLAGSGIGGTLFSFASIIFLIVSIIRVWKGETHHLAPLDEATSWLYERVEPRK